MKNGMNCECSDMGKRLVPVVVKVSFDEIKHRVYGYMSQVAVRMAKSGEEFDKIALTEDEDVMTFGVCVKDKPLWLYVDMPTGDDDGRDEDLWAFTEEMVRDGYGGNGAIGDVRRVKVEGRGVEVGRSGDEYVVGGLIDEGLAGLEERLGAFGGWCDVDSEEKCVRVGLGGVPGCGLYRYGDDVWRGVFRRRVTDYLVSVCVGGWMEIMGVRGGFDDFSEERVSDKLDLVRGCVDRLYVGRGQRYKIRNMGF